MNTKGKYSWGCHAWVYLHVLTFNYPQNPDQECKKRYKMFFNMQCQMLPCIWCRQSYTKFTSIMPIDNYLDSQLELSYWLYKIHNMVNDKLRNQGESIPPNPSFNEVIKKYDKYKAK